MTFGPQLLANVTLISSVAECNENTYIKINIIYFKISLVPTMPMGEGGLFCSSRRAIAATRSFPITPSPINTSTNRLPPKSLALGYRGCKVKLHNS